MTVVSAKSFPDVASLPLVADIQYREPYSSAAFNRKLRGILGMGLYKGLYPMPGSGLNLLISSQDSGDTSGTASFDIGDDYQITVRQQADITIAMTAGSSKIVALQCVFGLGIETYQVNSDSTVQAAEIVLLDAGTTLGSNQLELGIVTIPADATQITTDMIDVSGRILQTIGIELSSAIDSSSETVAANSYAIKRALDYVAGKFALLGSNADIISMSALTTITSSALSIAGALTLSSTLSVASAAAFSDAVTVGGKLTATGATTLASTLAVSDSAQFSSTLGVTGTLTTNYRGIISRDAAVPYFSFRRQDVLSTPAGDTEIGRVLFGYGLGSTETWGTGGVLSYIRAVAYSVGGGEVSLTGVDGSGNATSVLAMNGYDGKAYLTGQLSVSGATSLANNLDVTGTSTLAGALVAKSTMALAGAAALSSDLTVGGDVTVTGDSTLIGDVTITGTLSNPALFGRLLAVKVFTSSGTYKPTSGTVALLIEVLGAGGGGGSASGSSSSTYALGVGGGGGGYAKSYLTTVPSSAAVVVGAGGSAGVSGGTSSFNNSIFAYGGAGGGNSLSNTWAADGKPTLSLGTLGGGAKGGNILNAQGGASGNALYTQGSNCVSGGGGSSYMSGATLGTGGGSEAGRNGGLGAGGSGANAAATTTQYSGGTGGNGIVIIYEFA